MTSKKPRDALWGFAFGGLAISLAMAIEPWPRSYQIVELSADPATRAVLSSPDSGLRVDRVATLDGDRSIVARYHAPVRTGAKSLRLDIVPQDGRGAKRIVLRQDRPGRCYAIVWHGAHTVHSEGCLPDLRRRR